MGVVVCGSAIDLQLTAPRHGREQHDARRHDPALPEVTPPVGSFETLLTNSYLSFAYLAIFPGRIACVSTGFAIVT